MKQRNSIAANENLFSQSDKARAKNSRIFSGEGCQKKVKIVEPNNLTEDDDLNQSIPLTPELIQIQEEKVRLASAKSEVRHKKIKFTDDVQGIESENKPK